MRGLAVHWPPMGIGGHVPPLLGTHHYVYDDAGNIGSKQVEKPGLAATMATYGHNSLNQLTAIGGSGGTKTVIVREWGQSRMALT